MVEINENEGTLSLINSTIEIYSNDKKNLQNPIIN